MTPPVPDRHAGRTVVAVLVLVALMPGVRLPSIGTLGYMQYLWFQRIANFLDAVRHAHFADTFQGPHPGVTLMWILGAGLQTRTWLAGAPDAAAQLQTFELMQILWSTAVMILVFFALRRTLFVYGATTSRAHWSALLACALAALNPMFLTLTQVMALDGPLAVHVALALCLFLVALQTRTTRDYAFAGVAMGAALLTKMSALIFLFAALLGFALSPLRRGPPAPRRWRGVGLFSAACALTVFVCWPALWVSPLASLERIALTDTQAEQLRNGELTEILANRDQQAGLDAILDVILHPHRPGNERVVYGRTTSAWLHYPAVVLFKTPPLSLALALAGVGLSLLAWRNAAADPILRLTRHLNAANGFYFVCMSIAAKKTWRYLATFEVLLELCAGLTLAWLVIMIARRYGRVWAAALVVPLLAQSAYTLSYRPHFITYDDPLLGGQAMADEYLMLYWGEGAGEAARYMATHARATPVRFISENWDLANLLRIMLGQPDLVSTPDDAEFLVISYREVMMDALSRGTRYYWATRRPEYVAVIHGVPYVWVYRLDRATASIAVPSGPDR